MRVAVPVTNRSSDRCYPRISFIPIFRWKNPMINANTSFLQNRYRPLHYFAINEEQIINLSQNVLVRLLYQCTIHTLTPIVMV